MCYEIVVFGSCATPAVNISGVIVHERLIRKIKAR